jgi:taurine dioxygenase
MVSTVHISRTGAALGAVLDGIDFSASLDDETLSAISKALLEHQLLVMRAPDIDPAQHLRLAAQFGEAEIHAFFPNLGAGFEKVSVLDSEEGNVASMWHTDESFLPELPLGTLLSARMIPAYGGDTCWASTTAAYEALSPNMQRYLDGAMALHDLSRTSELAYNTGHGSAEKYSAAIAEGRTFRHPVVRTHPETGAKALFVNPVYTRSIVGVSPDESRAVLDFLYAHMTSARFQYRHRWQAGDLVMWDNRCTMHCVMRDFPGRRVMHRVSILGDRPR